MEFDKLYAVNYKKAALGFRGKTNGVCSKIQTPLVFLLIYFILLLYSLGKTPVTPLNACVNLL